MKAPKPLLMALAGTALGLLLILCGLAAYIGIAYRVAESRARAFCAALPSDISLEQTLGKAHDWKPAPDQILTAPQQGLLILTWNGALMDRWSCALQFEGDKLVQKKVNFID